MSNQAELGSQLAVSQTEVAPLLDRRCVGDGGRMMILLIGVEADCKARGISEERLQSYAYILSQKGIVPVSYCFHFSPLPFSDELAKGFSYMQESGYVSRDVKGTDVSGLGSFGDKLWLTAKGKEWVSRILRGDEPRVIVPIQEAIRELNGKSDAELYEECFQASQIPR